MTSYRTRQAEESSFPKPFVYREGTRLFLHFEIDAAQSVMDEERPEELVFNYTRLMMAVLLFVPEPGHLGCVGLGGGSIPKYYHRYLSHTRISIAEINPHVIELREKFHIPQDSKRFQVLQEDGASFVAANPNTFDVLMVDAFDHCGQPSHLCSTAFYQTCADALTENGYLVNLCHEGTAKAISRIEQVFGRRAYRLSDRDGRNIVVIVGKQDSTDRLLALPECGRQLERSHSLFFQEVASSIAMSALPIGATLNFV